jgi:LysM repeat protein
MHTDGLKPHTPPKLENNARPLTWLPALLWVFTAVWVLSMSILLILRPDFLRAEPSASAGPTPASSNKAAVQLPSLPGDAPVTSIIRRITPHTVKAQNGRMDVIEYTVVSGDSIFGIAKQFGIQPESVLWANYDVLRDDPHMISIGLKLKIPPVDGVYYQWKAGDTLEGVARQLGVDPLDITSWPSNHLDVTNPVIAPGSYVMVKGGHREFRTWVVPTFARGPAGVNKTVYGPGACDTGEGGAYGSGYFVWPTVNHYLSGNDFWSGHLAIDIAALTGTPVYAADSGVVVYAGVIGGGYGNMVMIDHGNGYQTVYAHLSRFAVRCGSSVSQGQIIAYAGSTGNSTGPHLHFEVRYYGAFINPWQVLP